MAFLGTLGEEFTLDNVCIRNQTVRHWNMLAVFSVLAVCAAAQSEAVTLCYCALSVAALVYFAVLTVKKQLRLTADVVICGAVCSLAGLSVYWYRYSLPVCFILVLLNVPFWVWVFTGLKDGMGLFLNRYKSGREYEPGVIRWACVLVFLFTCMMLGLFWYAWRPYRTSADTVNQWAQIHGEIGYSDVHAIGHTIMLKALLGIWDSYVIVIAFQVLCTAVLYAAFAGVLLKNRVPAGLIFAGIILYNWGLAPIQPIVYPWKDWPYTLCVAALTLLMMDDTLKSLRENRRHGGVVRAIVYGALFAGIYLFRLNGILIVLFTGGYIAIRHLKRRRFAETAAMIMVCAAIIGGTNWYGYQVLGAKQAENGFGIAVFGSGLAAAVTDDRITQEELDMIDEVLPVEWMQEHYSYISPLDLIWDQDETVNDPETEVYNNQFVVAMGRNRAEVIRLYLKLLPNHWKSYVMNILHSTTVVWGHDTFAFHSFYDNVTQMVLIGFALFLICRDSFGKIWAVLTPVGWNAVSIAISSITNEQRYLQPTTMLAPFLIMFFLAVRTEQAREK